MLDIVNFIDKSFLSVYNNIFIKSRFTTWTSGEFISAELEFNIYSSSKFFTVFFTFFNVSFFHLPFFYYLVSNFVVDSTYESARHGQSSSFVTCLLDVNFTVGFQTFSPSFIIPIALHNVLLHKNFYTNLEWFWNDLWKETLFL